MAGGIGERLAYIDQVIGAALAEVFQPQKPWPHDSRRGIGAFEIEPLH